MESTGGTRQRLIAVTRGMIDAAGVDSVSMRDLGRAMGLSRTAVYRHFADKDTLLAAVATEDFRALSDSLAGLRNGIDDPRELVHEILHRFYDFGMASHERFGLMFFRHWEREVHEDLDGAARELFAVIHRAIEQAHGQGVPGGRSPRQLTAMSAAFVTGLVEFNRAGHVEPEKGFGDPSGLIDAFFDAISA